MLGFTRRLTGLRKTDLGVAHGPNISGNFNFAEVFELLHRCLEVRDGKVFIGSFELMQKIADDLCHLLPAFRALSKNHGLYRFAFLLRRGSHLSNLFFRWFIRRSVLCVEVLGINHGCQQLRSREA